MIVGCGTRSEIRVTCHESFVDGYRIAAVMHAILIRNAQSLLHVLEELDHDEPLQLGPFSPTISAYPRIRSFNSQFRYEPVSEPVSQPSRRESVSCVLVDASP